MNPATEATIPAGTGDVSCEEWGIGVQHPNGAVSHLPPGTELNDDFLQALDESAEMGVRLHRRHLGYSPV